MTRLPNADIEKPDFQYSAPGGVTVQLAAYVKFLRRARGISGADLSSRMTALGCPLPLVSLSRWENGKLRAISVDQLVALSEIFGLTPGDLLAGRCSKCNGAPPVGFSCTTCGLSGVAT